MILNSLQKELKKPESLILIFILAVAAFLRFWKYSELQFMHDELSALDRLHFDTWDEFIEKGVKPDGHPMGVQMYLKLHQFLFGINEVSVKFPFTIIGLISIYQVYKIGKNWFTSTTGLFAAALFTISHHSIYYHTIIRPYSPGILFSLLLVRVWTKIFLHGEANKNNFILYGVVLGGLAYTHYFALLFGVLLSLVGLFWIKKKHVPNYVLSGLIGLILFIPNLSFMFDLVSEGNLGWLEVVSLSEALNYYYYIFNFSVPLIVITALVLIVFALKGLFKWEEGDLLKKRLTIFFLSFSSFAIAQWYSYNFQPVFQYAVLVFTFPIFAIFIFSFLDKFSDWINALGVVLILIFGVFGLVKEKRHYEIATNQPFEKFYNLISKESNSLNICGHERNMIYLYFDHEDSLNIRLHSLKDDNISLKDVNNLLRTHNYEKVVTSNIPSKFNSLIALYYPYVEQKERGVFLNNYVFSKTTGKNFYYQKESLLPKGFDTAKVFKKQWGPKISKLNFDSLRKNQHDIIDVFAEIEILSEDSLHNFTLVTNVKNSNDSVISWKGASSRDFKSEGKSFWLTNSYEIPMKLDSLNDLTIGTVLWNRSLSEYSIKSLSYGIREGNPNLYSIFKPIKD